MSNTIKDPFAELQEKYEAAGVSPEDSAIAAAEVQTSTVAFGQHFSATGDLEGALGMVDSIVKTLDTQAVKEGIMRGLKFNQDNLLQIITESRQDKKADAGDATEEHV